MSFAFDLLVPRRCQPAAPAILDLLAAGTMPCDSAWPKEKIDVFRRWIEAGRPAEPMGRLMGSHRVRDAVQAGELRFRGGLPAHDGRETPMLVVVLVDHG